MSEQTNQFYADECVTDYELEDYEGATPRWCKGCGDFAVLTGVQKLLRDRQIDPNTVVCVSGIGCSSRFPHYLKTYGFHGIHGRALSVTTGIALARPDLHLLTIMGDGDCFSIGGNHWIHTLRYNIHATVLVLDNEVYGLTKMQASPTTPQGHVTNTTPRGAYLKPMNPLSIMLGITNVSFLAQTASWIPGHVEQTLARAWDHKGLSFVRVLQRCPVFMPGRHDPADPNFPAVFLEGDGGIPVEKGILRNAPTLAHDPSDLHHAQRIATNGAQAPLGLLYCNPEIPTYQDIRHDRITRIDRKTLVKNLHTEFEKYMIQ